MHQRSRWLKFWKKCKVSDFIIACPSSVWSSLSVNKGDERRQRWLPPRRSPRKLHVQVVDLVGPARGPPRRCRWAGRRGTPENTRPCNCDCCSASRRTKPSTDDSGRDGGTTVEDEESESEEEDMKKIKCRPQTSIRITDLFFLELDQKMSDTKKKTQHE